MQKSYLSYLVYDIISLGQSELLYANNNNNFIMQIDRRFNLTIPTYQKLNDLIIYNFKLEDTIINKIYTCNFRFKDLQQFHKILVAKNYSLPEFPKTHFWVKTNKDPKLIQQRRIQLEIFFNTVINDPNIRGHREIKDFITTCKKEILNNERCKSQQKLKVDIYFRRAKSLVRDKPLLYIEPINVKISK